MALLNNPRRALAALNLASTHGVRVRSVDSSWINDSRGGLVGGVGGRLGRPPNGRVEPPVACGNPGGKLECSSRYTAACQSSGVGCESYCSCGGEGLAYAFCVCPFDPAVRS
jgi:hypothetical protein